MKADGTTATDGITYVSHDENTATVEITHDGIFCMRGKVETEPEASEDVIDDDISYG